MLDPIMNDVLQFLSDNLPSPLYSLLLYLLSHGLAFAQAVYTLTAAMMAKHPTEWDTQTVLPPLIAIFGAYLALASLYRTASWMLRTSFFFVKWGIIFGALMGGAGWMMASQQQSPQSNNSRLSTGGLVGLAMDAINGANANIPRTTSQSQTRNPPNPPRVWESFDRHRAWNQKPEQLTHADELDPKAIIGKISEWWDQMKDIMAVPMEGDGKTGKGKTSVSR